MKKTSKLSLYILSEYRNELYGASILWILLFHSYLCEVYYFEEVPVLKYIGKFIGIGNIGVDVFLFLSGISLYFSFVKNSDMIEFIKKRLIRVLEPVFICCGTYWGVMIINNQLDTIGVLSRLTTFRFWITGDQQIWFVSLILLCYFLYPYIYHWFFDKEKGIIFRCLFLLGVVLVINWILCYGHPELYKRIEIAISRIPVFIIGCVFGNIVYKKKEISGKNWYLIVAICIISFSVIKYNLLQGMWHRYLYGLCGIAITFVFAGIFKYMPIFIRKFFRLLGNMSLELYLFNIITKRLYEGGFLWKYEAGNALRYTATVVLCILGGLLISKLENNLNKMLKVK